MSDGEKQEQGRYLPMEWVFPEGVATRLATNILVQHNEDGFFISFFEVRPPIVFSDSPEEWANVQSIKAECVARVLVPTSRMKGFLGALNGNFERWEKDNEQAVEPAKRGE